MAEQDDALAPLDQLKRHWERASPQERAGFIEWVIRE
jgi:hypothetical protein